MLGYGSAGGFFHSPLMNVNRDTMRLAAGFPPTRGVDAIHAADGPGAVEEKASGDGDGGCRTRGVVTDVYVHWRPIEPCRRDVQRAEVEVLDAAAKLAKAVPAAAATGAEEMQPVEALAALNLADARLAAARAALHNELGAAQDEYKRAKERIVELEIAPHHAAARRAEAAFAADVAAVIKAGGNIADSVLINEAHVTGHRAQAAEAKRRDEIVTAQAAGALARCDDVWTTAYPNTIPGYCLPVEVIYYDLVPREVSEARLQEMKRVRAEAAAAGKNKLAINDAAIKAASAAGHGLTRPPVSEKLSRLAPFYPDNLHADLNQSALLVLKVWLGASLPCLLF